ncbi:MAG: class I SAM-dependent methyltransferase [Solirubrobacterales bacterium]|nr:class I SAM-dependent methyltransferase [Solirubrobacterales bacterium]
MTDIGPIAWLEHRDGEVAIEERPDGRRDVTVHPAPEVFVSRSRATTAYPVALIAEILRLKGVSYLCDEIARDEDPDYVERFLRFSLLGYVPEEAFRGERLLDFGSGSGASTVRLATMLPDTEIVGVELEAALIGVARMRADFYGMAKLRFQQSPSAHEVSPALGSFRFVNLGAVYEHLLPDERRSVLRQLWARLERGGVMFVNQLPYRYSPIETHTTGLPLINYVPERWAQVAATRYSRRVSADAQWPQLLRAGIRGGTARSVLFDLLRDGGEARLLQPTQMDLRDHADLWFACASADDLRSSRSRRVTHEISRALSRVARRPLAPTLNLAFQKLA